MSRLFAEFDGAPVLITGHTGFKGSWLSTWLTRLGARVHGVALDPTTSPALFDISGVAHRLASDTRIDIRDAQALEVAVATAAPRVVFHLAAQPLVRESYAAPVETFETNVIGTANLLDAIRAVPSVEAVVVVTTDKVYANREWNHPYRELDELGGHDPYSASKAACELVVASMRKSFFAEGACIATARAGNVIGGGDFSRDRLVPDCLRAFGGNQTVTLRAPHSVRPWQHVLESLAGYLMLAERLLGREGRTFAQGWNFGPDLRDEATVGEVAERLAALWGAGAQVRHDVRPGEPHEAGLLRLDNSLARTRLGWRPRLGLDQSLGWTVDWERARLRGDDMRQQMERQIGAYQTLIS